MKIKYDNGFWKVNTDGDGNISVEKHKISDEQFNQAMKILKNLNNNGFAEKEENERK